MFRNKITVILCSYRYLEKEHIQYCYSGATGLAKLPLNSVFVDGFRDPSRPTTATLPNGDVINATNSYKMILSFFTSNNITPEELKDNGYKKLDALLSQVGISLFVIGVLPDTNSCSWCVFIVVAKRQQPWVLNRTNLDPMTERGPWGSLNHFL